MNYISNVIFFLLIKVGICDLYNVCIYDMYITLWQPQIVQNLLPIYKINFLLTIKKTKSIYEFSSKNLTPFDQRGPASKRGVVNFLVSIFILFNSQVIDISIEPNHTYYIAVVHLSRSYYWIGFHYGSEIIPASQTSLVRMFLLFC